MNQAMEVLTSQNTVEWYTPPELIRSVKHVLGEIDCDPASHPVPQQWIEAKVHYTQQDNGLVRPWIGRVFLNPPFSKTSVWVDKLVAELACGNTSEAILLTNSAPGYVWWEEAVDLAISVCMLRNRMRFVAEDGSIRGQAKKGQSVFYFGKNKSAFVDEFSKYGRFIWR